MSYYSLYCFNFEKKCIFMCNLWTYFVLRLNIFCFSDYFHGDKMSYFFMWKQF